MKTRIVLPSFVIALGLFASGAAAQESIADRYRATSDRIIKTAFSDSSVWNRLAEMTDKFGNRLSGSQSLENTIDWILVQMKNDGLENVRGEKVMVPHWVRGEE